MESRYGCLSAACTLVLLIAPLSGLGATFRVPSQFPTIQTALDACTLGDTVLVAPGVYEQPLTIYASNVVLMSEEGPQVTTIDARGIFTAVSTARVPPVEGVTIEGFRITHGYGGGWFAGGIHVEVDAGGGRATIRNNIIEHNAALGLRAAGVYAGFHSTVEDNLIQYNEGGDVAALEADGIVRRNMIRHNGLNGTSLFIVQAGSGEFTDNVIVNNGPANITSITLGGRGAFRNNTIVDTIPRSHVVGLLVWEPFDFSSNIVVYDTGRGVNCSFVEGVPRIACNNVWGHGENWFGECAGQGGINGNFSADPLFCDSAGGDYRLSPDSPCAPENAPAGCGLIGALPVGCGATGVAGQGVPQPRFRLEVTPNPVRSNAEFTFDASHEARVLRIYDPQGRLVKLLQPSGGSSLTWTVPGEFAGGIYFAELRGAVGNRPGVRRFVVLR